ncbi:hypothetical protein Mgra_00006459 [Meloidogyne graminicola]|uniref:TAR DNA-binding protein 43 N-terminal domain-containing protein n=1 Tax=Meloidogyne graminicola TaxID=189291 RepID=A0A8S9ZLI7_9BILA|nr:hypothetical protein Mgra_00006459 [Meloidogyne graminicola]
MINSAASDNCNIASNIDTSKIEHVLVENKLFSFRRYIPTGADGLLKLTDVEVYFPEVVGLEYKLESGHYCILSMTEERDKFIPPADGWKQNCVFFVVANGEKKTPIIDQILTDFLFWEK